MFSMPDIEHGYTLFTILNVLTVLWTENVIGLLGLLQITVMENNCSLGTTVEPGGIFGVFYCKTESSYPENVILVCLNFKFVSSLFHQCRHARFVYDYLANF